MKKIYIESRKKRHALSVSIIYALFSFALMLGALPVLGQGRVVTGRVVDDEQNEPIPGATILIKGTEKGTITDLDGNYRLELSADDAVLVISFVGYESQEISVGSRSVVDISLQIDIASLEEVVVIGYGTQKKALNTGANLRVEGADIQRLSTTNALQGLQGQSPGVQLTSTSGQPGSSMRVIIRGTGSLSGSDPLYVVDGVLTGDVSYLNPADIASVDILKDAASAAIYGSQASNGVVLITTRQGQSGRTQITFDSYYGVQNVARKADMLNGREYAIIMNEAAINSGKLPYFSQTEIDSLANNPNTNWMDQMFVDNAATQNYVLGISGGTEFSRFSTSLSYTSQEGIVGGADLSNYERFNFRVNSERDLFDGKLTIGENLTFAYTKSNGIGVGNQYNNSLRGAFNTSPMVPVYDSLGNFWDNSNATWHNGEANPYAQMVYTNQNERNGQKLVGNLYAELKPIKGLSIKSRLGVDYYVDESHSYTPEYQLSIFSFSNFTWADQKLTKGRTLIWDNWLSYDFNLGSNNFTFLVGSTAYQFQGSYLYGKKRDVVFNDLEHAYIDNATNSDGANITLNGGTSDPDAGLSDPDHRLSYFARINYNFDEKYLLNASFRADGSSKFGEGNQWGYFPSVSAGWVISNESFLNTSTVVRFLKLRGSWGQVGSQNAGAYQFLAPVKTQYTNYSFGTEEGILTPGVYPSRLANPDLKWETSEQLNVGFDSRLLNGFSLSFDWYKKTNKDWLVRPEVLATAGADAPWINGGNVTNTGVEILVSYSGNSGDLYYTIGGNVAYNQNDVGQIPTNDGIIHGADNQLNDNSPEFYRAQSGFPIGYFWGLETQGIFQTEEEVQAHRSTEGVIIQPDARAGDARYVDQNNDGLINDNDKIMVGDPNPDFIFGLNLSAEYKGLDFSLLASGVAGNQIVQSYRNHSNQYANYTSAILDRWHGAGTSNEMPRVTENGVNWANFSDLFVQNGDYLRISNVTIGYDFARLIPGDAFGKVRLFVSGQNLFTFTKYDGMDPEVGFGIDNANDDSYKFSSGIDLGYYPRPRTYMVGLNVSF